MVFLCCPCRSGNAWPVSFPWFLWDSDQNLPLIIKPVRSEARVRARLGCFIQMQPCDNNCFGAVQTTSPSTGWPLPTDCSSASPCPQLFTIQMIRIIQPNLHLPDLIWSTGNRGCNDTAVRIRNQLDFWLRFTRIRCLSLHAYIYMVFWSLSRVFSDPFLLKQVWNQMQISALQFSWLLWKQCETRWWLINPALLTQSDLSEVSEVQLFFCDRVWIKRKEIIFSLPWQKTRPVSYKTQW